MSSTVPKSAKIFSCCKRDFWANSALECCGYVLLNFKVLHSMTIMQASQIPFFVAVGGFHALFIVTDCFCCFSVPVLAVVPIQLLLNVIVLIHGALVVWMSWVQSTSTLVEVGAKQVIRMTTTTRTTSTTQTIRKTMKNRKEQTSTVQ